MGSPTQSPVPLSPPTKQKPKVADRIVSRASNAWILYRSDAIARIRAAEPEQLQQHSQADLSKLIAARWRTESVETKRLYELKAKQRKQDHVGSPVYRRPSRSKKQNSISIKRTATPPMQIPTAAASVYPYPQELSTLFTAPFPAFPVSSSSNDHAAPAQYAAPPQVSPAASQGFLPLLSPHSTTTEYTTSSINGSPGPFTPDSDANESIFSHARGAHDQQYPQHPQYAHSLTSLGNFLHHPTFSSAYCASPESEYKNIPSMSAYPCEIQYQNIPDNSNNAQYPTSSYPITLSDSSVSSRSSVPSTSLSSPDLQNISPSPFSLFGYSLPDEKLDTEHLALYNNYAPLSQMPPEHATSQFGPALDYYHHPSSI